MKALISTWKMSLEGAKLGMSLLQNGKSASEAVVEAIRTVEDEPSYQSVGYGGLPDCNGRVLLDAAYMDGNTMRFGAVMSVEGIRNPILAAKALCGRKTNCLLCGRGAEDFALRQGLETAEMRTEASMSMWREERLKNQDAFQEQIGHDTVCVLAMDDHGSMISGTSTSGLFMKDAGRVGDTPIIGSGFYCDATIGAAAATGVGEEIMRGCLSYEIVSLMRSGFHPKEACERAVSGLQERIGLLGEKLLDNVSVIALRKDGAFGAATTKAIFPFAAGCNEIKLYATTRHGQLAETTLEKMANEP